MDIELSNHDLLSVYTEIEGLGPYSRTRGTRSVLLNYAQETILDEDGKPHINKKILTVIDDLQFHLFLSVSPPIDMIRLSRYMINSYCYSVYREELTNDGSSSSSTNVPKQEVHHSNHNSNQVMSIESSNLSSEKDVLLPLVGISSKVKGILEDIKVKDVKNFYTYRESGKQSNPYIKKKKRKFHGYDSKKWKKKKKREEEDDQDDRHNEFRRYMRDPSKKNESTDEDEESSSSSSNEDNNHTSQGYQRNNSSQSSTTMPIDFDIIKSMEIVEFVKPGSTTASTTTSNSTPTIERVKVTFGNHQILYYFIKKLCKYDKVDIDGITYTIRVLDFMNDGNINSVITLKKNSERFKSKNLYEYIERQLPTFSIINSSSNTNSKSIKPLHSTIKVHFDAFTTLSNGLLQPSSLYQMSNDPHTKVMNIFPHVYNQAKMMEITCKLRYQMLYIDLESINEYVEDPSLDNESGYGLPITSNSSNYDNGKVPNIVIRRVSYNSRKVMLNAMNNVSIMKKKQVRGSATSTTKKEYGDVNKSESWISTKPQQSTLSSFIVKKPVLNDDSSCKK